MIYLDSSVLLEIYLAQPNAGCAREWLLAPTSKMSSWLLAVEVPVVLRRLLDPSRGHEAHLASALVRFDQDLRGVDLYEGLSAVAGRVRADPRFARCRALDAIHLATALLLKEETGQAVQLATFDHALAAAAEPFGLATLRA